VVRPEIFKLKLKNKKGRWLGTVSAKLVHIRRCLVVIVKDDAASLSEI
jgi:hypothetical protein